MFRYLPEQASEVAAQVDWLHNWITDISVFFTVLIVGAMIYFAARYRQRDGVDHDTPRIKGSNFLEIIWTTVPTLICIWIAYEGVVIYQRMVEVAPDAIEINVQAQKWKWDFEQSNGKKTTGQVTIPVNRAVKFVLSSTDVLHSFFVPSMRAKNDAVPGMYTYVTFKPIKTGEYPIFCTEYCGTNHSQMMAKLNVVSEAEYQRWLNDRSAEEAKERMGPEMLGKALYSEKGCVACHSLDGSPRVGPSFLKLWGSERAFAEGESVPAADENYIRESILYPNKRIVKGFAPNQMPSFDGQLSDQEILGLIAFIKAQDGSAPAVEEDAAAEEQEDLSALPPAERGQRLYVAKGCNACHSLDGSRIVGPSWKGIYGKQGKLADGSDYVANDEYIKRSIANPNDQLVEGYAGGMIPYQLTDQELSDLIEYMKTL